MFLLSAYQRRTTLAVPKVQAVCWLGSVASNPPCQRRARLICSAIVLRQESRSKWANARPGGIRSSFPSGTAVVLETLSQVYGKIPRRDCKLIPLSAGFNYPQARGFKGSFVHKSRLGLRAGHGREMINPFRCGVLGRYDMKPWHGSVL